MQRGRVDAKAPPQTFYRLKAPQSAQTPSLEYLSDSHTLLNILDTFILDVFSVLTQRYSQLLWSVPNP